MSDHAGPSSFETAIAMKMGDHSGHSASSIGAGGGAEGMLPFGEQGFEITSFGSVDQTLSTGNMDSFFDKLKEHGGALGQTLKEVFNKVTNYLVGEEAKGGELNVSNLTKHENWQAPTAQGDLQVKKIGVIGNDGGQGHG